MSDNDAQIENQNGELAEELNERVGHLMEQLAALQQISYFVDSAMELPDILRKIVTITAELMGADVCSIYLLADDKKTLVLRASRGLDPALVGKAHFHLGESIPGWVAEHQEVLALADAGADPRAQPIKYGKEIPLRASICGPLDIREELVGVMTVRMHAVHEFDESERTVFETICKQVGIVIEKSRMYFDIVDAQRLAAIGLSLSEVSHYIKNILSNIQGGLYLVESGLDSGDLIKSREAWGIVKKNNRKIANLVQNMLGYSRKSKITLDRDNLNMLITDILESVKQTARDRNVAIEPHLDPDLPDVYFDYDQLYNSVLNLVSNAVESIPKQLEGKVEIHTWLDAELGEVNLRVSDNGAGIAKDDRHNIFKLFFSTKGAQGTGIGLAVTKKIIEEHGGRIAFESTEGEGTTFTLQLPLLPPNGE